ncbi:MAG: complex I NDUFA9 subunit family protein [Rhodospirillaceae bacterium]|nr:complex I NDUFA9 subunit family protein [Rhodospirillaceae bacterium]
MAPLRATVFGGSGFVGRAIVQRLAKAGAVVRVAVRDPEAALFLKPMGAVGQIAPIHGEVRSEKAVAAAVAGVDLVVNAVGLGVETRRDRFADVHVRGARNVARAAAAAGVRHFVHLSGIGSDPHAPSTYAAARGHGDRAVREAFPQAILLKPSVVFGPGDHFFTTFAALARLAPALPLFGGGTARLQPVYVGDVADAAMKALGLEAAVGQDYELGGPTVYTYRELMELLLRTVDRKRMLVSVPTRIALIMATFAGLLPKPPLTRDMVRLATLDNVVGDAAKRLADLGIAPHSVELILPTYMDRYRRGGRWRHVRYA